MTLSTHFELTRELIESRRTTSARRLFEPGPDKQQLSDLLALAAAAPDHDRITPWRFIVVPTQSRNLLAQAFKDALLERDQTAAVFDIERAGAKAFHSPTLVLCIARLIDGEGSKSTSFEKLVSLGAAIQNILLGAHAMGFNTGLTSGQAMASESLRNLLQLDVCEHPICCINIGTAQVSNKDQYSRPALNAYTGELLQINNKFK